VVGVTFSDSSRRPVIAYIRMHLLRAEHELPGLKDMLAGFATQEGFILREAFVEDSATDLTAFAALVEAASRPEIKVVLLPSLLHLAAIDSSTNLRQIFEKATDARVMLLNSPKHNLGRAAEPIAH
jgi:hypothetical protein